MHRILCGIETEYGLHVDGRTAEDQIDDSMALVRSYPGECLASWDYRYESPRADLRGFTVDRLSEDPTDAQFDIGRARPAGYQVRSDRILPNGARFYNDHGHPEYATPECWSPYHAARHDKAGELAVLRAARAFAPNTTIYKNNTDFHGASYGTHESYLVPRSTGFDALYRSVVPMLIARQILCGAGKVGSETGAKCSYQLSQRADFFTELANPDTLYRRPIFNTRDEPHADPARWVRLHVIASDANMIENATRLKMALIQIALHLAIAGETPDWPVADPVRAIKEVSRDEAGDYRIDLSGRNWTTAEHVLESYCASMERLGPNEECAWAIERTRTLLDDLRNCPERFASRVDWAAKRALIESYMESEGLSWRDPALQSVDLAYSNVDPDEGLFHALEAMGRVERQPNDVELEASLHPSGLEERTRAYARGLAIEKFRDSIETACWRSITFKGPIEVELGPDKEYPQELEHAQSVERFIELLRGAP